VDKLEAEADAIDAKARRDDAIARDDSDDKEVKNELERAKILADIDNKREDRKQMQLTNQSKEKANATGTRKKNAGSAKGQKKDGKQKKKT
jgi:hypothetical protein